MNCFICFCSYRVMVRAVVWTGEGSHYAGINFPSYLFYIWQLRKLVLIGSIYYATWKEVFLVESIISSGKLVPESVCCVHPVRLEMKAWGSWDCLSELQESGGNVPELSQILHGREQFANPLPKTVMSTLQSMLLKVEFWIRWRRQSTELLIFKGILAHENLHSDSLPSP